jgi:hypothetical protein
VGATSCAPLARIPYLARLGLRSAWAALRPAACTTAETMQVITEETMNIIMEDTVT